MANGVPYKPRNRWKARVFIEDGVVVKDYTRSPSISRLYGRICLNWEEAALRTLKGIQGVPLLYDRPTPYRLGMSLVPGVPLEKHNRGEISELFLNRLKALFTQMHERGVAHGDAHFRNILIDNDQPYLIDFSTSYTKGRIKPFDKRLFRWFCLLDYERLYKVEKRFFGRGAPPHMFLLYRLIKNP